MCLLLIFAPVLLISLCLPYFYFAFDRFNVWGSFASSAQTWAEFTNLIVYIHPPFLSTLNTGFFAQQDVLHMQDVRYLFIFMWACCLISLIGVIFWRKSSAKYVRNIFTGWMCALASLLFISIWQWQKLFVLFHQFIFPYNNYWQLDPSTSNLIKYFNNNIFHELFIIYGIIMLVEFVVIHLWHKNQNRKDQS